MSLGQTFNHATIYVVDTKLSAKFYSEVIGITEIKNPYNDGITHWFKIGDGIELHITGKADKKIYHDITVHIAFSVMSVSVFSDKLSKMSIPYYNSEQEKSKVTDRPDGVKQIYFQDPDGYWIEVNDELSKQMQ